MFSINNELNKPQTLVTEQTTNTRPPEQTTNTRPPTQTTFSRPAQESTDSSPPEENTNTEEFQDCYEDDDFQLTIEDVEQLDLLSFVDSTKINAQNTDLFETNTVGDIYPSFSLGLDDDEDIPPITPKPALREKSSRALKISRFGKSPFIERVIDIYSKITNQEFGVWRYMSEMKDPM